GDGRAGHHLAGDRVDHHGGGDEPAVGEDAALGQQRLAHVADGQPVHVDVPGVDVADDAGPALDQVDHVAVVAEHDPLGRDPGLLAQPGVRAQVPPFAVHRHEVARLDHVEQIEQLAGG